jgi:hypothetical protein
MGYYTELKLDVILNNEGPLDIINGLCNEKLMDKLYIDKFGKVPVILSVCDTPNLPIEHIFGKSHRWDHIFSNASFNKETNRFIVDCDIKAYDDIYEHLVDWLTPFIISGSIQEKGEDQDEWITMY